MVPFTAIKAIWGVPLYFLQIFFNLQIKMLKFQSIIYLFYSKFYLKSISENL